MEVLNLHFFNNAFNYQKLSNLSYFMKIAKLKQGRAVWIALAHPLPKMAVLVKKVNGNQFLGPAVGHNNCP